MDLNEMMDDTDRLLQEKVVTTEFVSKRLNSLFIQLSEELSPTPEVEKAHLFINKWKKRLEENNEEHNKVHKTVMDGINDLTAMTIALTEAARNNQDTTDLTKAIMNKKIEIPANYTDYSWVLNDGDVAINMFAFQREAVIEIKHYLHKFRWLNILLKFSKAIIFTLAAIASYYIGEFVEKEFKLNGLIITILTTLVCFYTTDEWLNRLKANIFWRISRQLFQHFKNTYIHFIGLKLQFKVLITKWPQILT